jgi:hypothetical protein
MKEFDGCHSCNVNTQGDYGVSGITWTIKPAQANGAGAGGRKEYCYSLQSFELLSVVAPDS